MSPNLLLEILDRIPMIITDYAGSCSEIAIQANIALAYELVDEIVSFGCPQATDSGNLLHLIHNQIEQHFDILQYFRLFPGPTDEQYGRPLSLDIDKRTAVKNEIFFKIEERLSMTIAPTQQIMMCNTAGTIKTKSYLLGTPSATIWFDQQTTFRSRPQPKDLPLWYDDVIFNPTVSMSSFDSDRTINFSPVAGETLLMSYRTTRAAVPPLMVNIVFENKQAKVVVVRVSIVCQVPPEATMRDILVSFQAPKEISNGTCEIPPSLRSWQHTNFDRVNRQITWKVPEMKGQTEFSARFRFIFDEGIPATPESLLGPISAQFRIPDCNASGLQFKDLVISNTGSHTPQKWVKQTVFSGDYVFNLI
jgi:hypothetical protein